MANLLFMKAKDINPAISVSLFLVLYVLLYVVAKH